MGRAIDVVTGAYYDHGRGRMESESLMLSAQYSSSLGM